MQRGLLAAMHTGRGGGGGGVAARRPRRQWKLLDVRAASATSAAAVSNRLLRLDTLNAHIAPNAARSRMAQAHVANMESALLSRPSVRGCRIWDAKALSHTRGRAPQGRFNPRAFARYYNDA